MLGSYIPVSANCKERDIDIIIDLVVFVIGPIVFAGIVFAVLSTKI